MDTMTINKAAAQPAVSAPTIKSDTAPAQHANSAATEALPATGASRKPDAQNLEAQKAILRESTEKFNKMSEDLNLDVKFAYNDKIDQIYLNVIDKHTGRVIRKLPSEEAMKISESMKELVGTLMDQKG